MKKKISLLLSVLFVFALFSGCGNTNTTTTGTDTPASTSEPASNNDPAETSEVAEPEENSDYNFAIGKYDLDENGYPTGYYTYPLPLSTTNEVMTVWTGTWSPEALPEEGFEAIDYQQELRTKSGINFEWSIVAYANRTENLAVLMASDDLCDLTVGIASYYTDSEAKIIDDGFLINICDYFDYTPNYRYLVVEYDDIDLTAKINGGLQGKSAWMPLIEAYPFPNMGVFIRGDWCESGGIDPNNIVTYDDLYAALTAFKTQLDNRCPFPCTHPLSRVPDGCSRDLTRTCMSALRVCPHRRLCRTAPFSSV
jgi:ABC-type glycerol-3-phosphate transport system substrate-binding protein